MYALPENNYYVPPRQHIVPKPNFLDGDKEEEGYRYNLNRVSPALYLNPLKSKFIFYTFNINY